MCKRYCKFEDDSGNCELNEVEIKFIKYTYNLTPCVLGGVVNSQH